MRMTADVFKKCARRVRPARRGCGWRQHLLLAASLFAVFNLCAQAARAQSSAPPQATDAAALVGRLRSSSADTKVQDEARTLGVELIRAARYEEALSLFAALRDAAPSDAAAHYGGALALFNLKRVADAETWARAAVERAATNERAKATKAANANADADASNNRDEASVFGGEADALVLLGVVLAVKGDNAGALRAVTRAAEIAPRNFDAQLTLGRALYGANDHAAAARAFRAATGLRPHDAGARFFLATALERAGDDAAALAAYRELAASHPAAAQGHLGVGVLLVKRGAGAELEEGIGALRKALAIDDRLYEGQVSLGRALVRAGRAAESLAPLKRAAELAPHNPEPHYQLAIAYRRLGDRAAADRESAIVQEIHRARRTSAAARTGENAPNEKQD